ncbi:UDP-N-acetylglucosamine 2-epimerase [[Brevibacterium] flavum]|uniref:UDP-N-acetylglucosamine 2-epimerase (non-hydrolyzing) n=1 Tax=[Brevibacterium] flavum TaxID=92706 RepID=A0A0F6Z4E1_9CORY|nr:MULTISPECIES: UDP-N-acetylglucosamine 2-epimerase (non-hydrolyzing) [Corynebacterium]AKF26410.1 UDP-N-acetylglucosamine 2-epimerase [[Brevibacterium] flavum]ANE07235.1 UDP-N-acetyl glucosamine 2-epimerase [Corynebacterium glutamicum]AST19644.1 UDP-N-acetylglucosamine 2-epimerase (non-hydrolyzing) [Corynebacterium glutamicum ATCC 14067]KEI22098.1 UDP-N-acetylglucosamine 2-epimerase [Corynebacterium glutamicum ATCC 14067]KIH74933.1 UDP-N-acetylglucosamine 2-epimerase [Corynebacterium glutamic
MRKPKIMTVYGTRPEAIKVAPVIKALEQDERFESVAVSTGQHKEMLDQVNDMFSIKPAYDLGLMNKVSTLSGVVSKALEGLDEIIEAENPDVIISQGDTSTAMSAALAGFHREVKIVHLEAGLRTGNIHSPFPEEANRRIIGQVSELHLAPTEISRENLRRENFRSADTVVVGNTVIDALLEAATWETTFEDQRLNDLVESDQRIVLVTTHRRENLTAMSEIGGAVQQLAEAYPDVIFALPLHLNPKVRDIVLPKVDTLPNVIITDPLPYDQFTKLMASSTLVLTDSGGVQEEAPAFGKPVLCMRENTERPEAVLAGTVKLVGTNQARIITETRLLLDDPTAFSAMAQAINPYGDGKAAERSVAAIAALLGVGERLPDFQPEKPIEPGLDEPRLSEQL